MLDNFEDIKSLIKTLKDEGVQHFSLKTGDNVEIEVDWTSQSSEVAASAAPSQSSVQYVMAPQSPGVSYLPPAAAPLGAPAPQAAATPQVAEAPAVADEANLLEITAPIVGRFYRKPDENPGTKPFVSVGDTVGPDTVICTIEVMKMFNEVKAEMSGVVVSCEIDDGAEVEYGQLLFKIRPH